MPSNKKRVADYISEFPAATNEEIATTLSINMNSVKAYISQLKSDGYIKVFTSGSERNITIITEFKEKTVSSATAERIEFKKDAYMKLLDRYMSDFELTDDIDKHLKLGNSILRILDNL